MSMCKRHKKVKDQVWSERQARGGSLNRVGCVDCKAEALNAPPRPRKPKVNAGYNPFAARRAF
jgi:hypothetical protein